IGKDSGERAVLSQLAGMLIQPGQCLDDGLDAVLDHALPLLEVPDGHAVRTMPGLPADDVLLGGAQDTLWVAHEGSEQRSVLPERLLLLTVQSRAGEARHLGAPDPSVGTRLAARQIATLAEVDDMLTRGAEDLRRLTRGQPVIVHA